MEINSADVSGFEEAARTAFYIINAAVPFEILEKATTHPFQCAFVATWRFSRQYV